MMYFGFYPCGLSCFLLATKGADAIVNGNPVTHMCFASDPSCHQEH